MKQLDFWWLIAAGAIFVGNASAATQASDGLRACMTENNDARRLACYDRELNRHASKETVSASAPAVAPSAAAPVAASAAASASSAVRPASQDDFGVRGSEVARQREEQQQKEDPKSNQLASIVAAIAKQPRGELVVTLDNGQVWQQKKPESYFPLKVGDQINIGTGALGSYRLSAPSGRSTAVTRVR